MREEKTSFENSLGQRLAAVAHWPERAGGRLPAVVLCHGMESSKDGAKHLRLAARLAEHGIFALRFDFSFCGESGRNFEEITFSQEVDDLAAAVAHARSLGAEEVGLFGSSMGGAVAVLYTGDDPGMACLVTLAAVSNPAALARRFLAAERVELEGGGFVAIGSGRRVRKEFFLDAMKQDVLGAARRIAAPSLVIHGAEDEVVPVSDALDLYGALRGTKELNILRDTDHRVTNPRVLEQVVQQTTDWFATHLRP